FYRYGRQRWINPNDQLGDPFVTDLSQTTSNTNQFHDLVIGHNWVISARKVNSFNAHVSDFVNEIGATPERMFTLATATGTATNPRIVFPSGEIGQNENVPQQTLQRKYQVRDDFSWTHNRHNIKFGGNYIYTAKLGGSFFFGAAGYSMQFWDDPSVILADLVTYPQGFATPGALASQNFSGGNGGFGQRVHQLAFYFQDDFKVTPRLTLNLGVRWDANIHLLPQQLGSGLSDTNRTAGILRELLAANPSTPGVEEGMARAALLAGNDDDLRRRTPSFKEFQPRLGFAWDPTGSGKHVIRGGYGIAFDQVFQNLTVFSIQQSHTGIYQTSINRNNDARPGACTVDPVNNPLCTFAFGVDPLPVSSGGEELEFGGLGFIVDPKARDPYAQQWSIGWQWQFHPDWALTADYYHVLGLHEPRILQMNPLVAKLCDAVTFPATANPLDPRCVAGASTRFFDAAFEAAGICGPTLLGPVCGAGRLGEVRATAFNNRSSFDSVNLQVRKRFNRRYMLQASYVLSWSNSWGGRPTSSYGGTALNIAPENQFLPSEYGPSNFDERHRFVFSGHFQLPGGIEVSPILQAASARAVNWRANADLDGDGRRTLDRVCVGSSISTPVSTLGCTFVGVNPLRGDPTSNLDVRLAKAFTLHKERVSLRIYWEFFNLFNTNNFGNSLEERVTVTDFLGPRAYLGTGTADGAGRGFGGGQIGPLRSQFGFRLTF
ncbi:MAG: TonB-dependent receptor domain-containing protein, partial [Terriglobales bacterium]